MKETILNIVVVVSAVIVSLIALEAVVRILDLSEEVAATHHLHAVSATDRLRFVANSQVLVDTVEYRYIQKANSYGRRDVEWTADMLTNPCNIILVGDSFVMGYGMDDDWVLDRLLEDHYAIEGRCVGQVFNFGIGGAVSTPEYTRLLADALEIGIAARTVTVSLFVGNDFSLESVAETNDAAQDRADAPDGAPMFLLRNSALAQLILRRIKYSARMTGVALNVGGLLGIPTYLSRDAYIYQLEYSEEERQHFEDILMALLRMRDMSVRDGKDFYVVVFPNKVQVENFSDLDNSVYDAERPNRLIREFCDGFGLECLDLLPALRRYYGLHETPLYFEVDRHLNKSGNEVAAREIYEFLKAQGR